MTKLAHYRITWSGVFGSTADAVEEWSMGLSAGLPSSPFLTRAELAPLANSLHNAWTDLAAGVNNQAVLTNCRIAHITVEGSRNVTLRDVDGAYVQADSTAADIPGTGSTSGPLQLALAVSLQSVASGPTGRGRFFLPAPVMGALGTDGRLQEAARDAHATRAAAFVNAVNGALDFLTTSQVVIASGGSAVKGIPAANHPVVRVGVGRVIDTQRRRRGDLSEEQEWVTL